MGDRAADLVRDDGAQDQETAGGRGRPPRRLGRKLALAVVSLLLAPLLFELAVRIVWSVPAPVRIAPGVYLSALPLLNRHYGAATAARDGLRGATLDRGKPDGTLRVAVFGESSVEGAPWGVDLSPVALLQRQLAAAWPDRRFEVINMGRGASVAMESWYYLLAVEPYEPDVVVFYLGANDGIGMYTDRETCAPRDRPGLHAAWRWLARRSDAAWMARVVAPHVFGAARNAQHAPASRDRDECHTSDVFERWAELLITTAQDMGAEVIVTLPLANTLDDVDKRARLRDDGSTGAAPPGDVTALRPAYRDVVVCRLTEGCDFRAAVEAFLRAAAPDGADPLVPDFIRLVLPAWERAAESTGARVIDPRPLFRTLSADGLLGPPRILDEMHLDLDGYWALARLWLEAMRERIEGRPAAPVTAAVVADDAALAALRDGLAASRPWLAGSLLDLAAGNLGRAHYLYALTELDLAARLFDSDEARRLRGWVRVRFGLPTGLPPAADAAVRAEGFVPARLASQGDWPRR